MRVNHINYYTSEGKVYCRKVNQIVLFDDEHTAKHCSTCDMYAGSAQGEGVECVWDDERDGVQYPHVVHDPVEEYSALNKPEMNKSSRHSKITGDFAESLVLYWLSKYGFECAKVDHTGIDLLARNPMTQELMGISVKSRSRTPGKEEGYVGITNDNFDKAEDACNVFGCVPYFAIVVDAKDEIMVFIIAMKKLLGLYPKGKTSLSWKMASKDIDRYMTDPEIQIIRFKHETVKWW